MSTERIFWRVNKKPTCPTGIPEWVSQTLICKYPCSDWVLASYYLTLTSVQVKLGQVWFSSLDRIGPPRPFSHILTGSNRTTPLQQLEFQPARTPSFGAQSGCPLVKRHPTPFHPTLRVVQQFDEQMFPTLCGVAWSEGQTYTTRHSVA
jgi:hypothetical protein